jgi:2,3-dihydroxybiphenyl 1,2-dioxygenase
MEVQALGYVGIGTDALDDWTEFATGMLGMQQTDIGNTARAFRMDDRKQRLILDRDRPNNSRYFGWEVADAAALDALAARLEAAGVAVVREPQTTADRRGVRGLISFADPLGNRLEAFHGAAVADTPFRPGRAISGFRTGPLGMGHAVLTARDVAPALRFYQDVLDFRMSDFQREPFVAYFLHVNGRHHSLALIETGHDGLHHLMVELCSLDDVGQGYDLAQAVPDRVATTLGRHTNDFVTSFYARTPAGFLFEYGWGGRAVDDATWQVEEMTSGPSLWGHDRTWLPEAQNRAARAIRATAAAEGRRAPVQVMDGNHQRLADACPWFDAVQNRVAAQSG